MSTTETHHEPSPGELDRAAGDGGRQDPPRQGNPADKAHGGGASDDGHGGHDAQGHGGEALGPIDVTAWGALLLGFAAGLIVVVCLVITNSLVTAPVG